MQALRSLKLHDINLNFYTISVFILLNAAVMSWLINVQVGLLTTILLGVAGLWLAQRRSIRFQKAVEHSPNAIFLVNNAGRIVVWNRACETTFHYGREVIGEHFQVLLVDSQDRLLFKSMIDRIFTSGQSFVNVELSYRTQQGETRKMLSRLFPLKNRQGKIHECVISNTEITGFKQMEKALQESEERFRLIAENVQEIFYLIDLRNQRVTYISPALQRLWGEDTSPFYDDPSLFFKAVSPEDAKRIQTAVQSRQDHEIEFRLHTKNHGMRWLRMRNTFLHDESNGPARIVGIAEDITARKQAAELALEKERMRILADFIRDASHEFRTPLSIINTKLYLMNRSESAIQRERLAADASDQVKQIDSLLESLVLMARLDSGIAFDMHPTDLNTLVQNVVSSVRPAVAASVLTLSLNVDEQMPQIIGDSDMLAEALENLLGNCLRYTPAGGHISVKTRAIAEAAHITITDTGSGISETALPHVFERFYRSDDAHSTRGFGLGLPIAQKIVEGHGGTIDIESAPGKGTTVYIVIPIKNGDTKPEAAGL